MHQTTTVVSETEGLAHLKSTRKLYEQKGVDAAVEAYLAAMGVGEPVMTLMRKTWAASIRWLSPAELKDSHLATLALDAAEPILASGANGLNGHAFDGDPPRSDLVQASVVRTVAGGGATLEVTFRYRPGGGAVEVEAIEHGLDSPQAADRSSPDSNVSAAGGRAAAVEDHRRHARSHPHPARALLRPRSWPPDHRFHAARTSAKLCAD